jgi:hypothetical protein
MKAFAKAIAAAIWGSTTLASGWGIRLDTPWGEIKTDIDPIQMAFNPLSYVNVTGIPTSGDAINSLYKILIN